MNQQQVSSSTIARIALGIARHLPIGAGAGMAMQAAAMIVLIAGRSR